MTIKGKSHRPLGSTVLERLFLKQRMRKKEKEKDRDAVQESNRVQNVVIEIEGYKWKICVRLSSSKDNLQGRVVRCTGYAGRARKKRHPTPGRSYQLFRMSYRLVERQKEERVNDSRLEGAASS